MSQDSLGVPAYCLTLRRHPKRAEEAREEFAREGVEARFVEGVDGEAWGLAVPHRRGDRHAVTPGRAGLWLSHWTLWRQILASGEEEALILEDDVTLTAGFKEAFRLARADLPADWQVAYVGHCCTDGRRTHRYTPRVACVEWPVCLHAYLVRRSALPVLLAAVGRPDGYLDQFLAAEVYGKGLLRCYTFLPGLAAQRTAWGRAPSLTAAAPGLPPAYCITLRSQPKRAAAARKEFARAGLSATMVEGVNGTAWGLESNKRRRDGWLVHPKHVGLCLSHWMVWQYARLSQAPEVLFFEDDVRLCAGFAEEFRRSLAAVPADWQMVYVGHCCADGKPTIRYNDRAAAVHWPLCTHAYLLRRSALDVLLEHAAEAKTHIDQLLVENVLNHHKLQCYTMLPGLATQHPPGWVG